MSNYSTIYAGIETVRDELVTLVTAVTAILHVETDLNRFDAIAETPAAAVLFRSVEFNGVRETGPVIARYDLLVKTRTTDEVDAMTIAGQAIHGLENYQLNGKAAGMDVTGTELYWDAGGEPKTAVAVTRLEITLK